MAYEKNYAKHYDLFNKEKDYGFEARFLKDIMIRFDKNTDGLKILNLGCGTGMHDRKLVDLGFKVTGMDQSAEMIEIAKQKVPEANYIVGDMSDFDLNEKFDVVICMFSSLGYLAEQDKVNGFFESVSKHLVEEGLLILDVWNGLGVVKDPPAIREKIVEDGNLKIVRTSYPNLDVQNFVNNVRFEIKVYENDKLVDEYEEHHKVRFFLPLEIKQYMEDVGINMLHEAPSYNLDETLNDEHWNMILIGSYFGG
jgi:SAM-dependent methyltransferase